MPSSTRFEIPFDWVGISHQITIASENPPWEEYNNDLKNRSLTASQDYSPIGCGYLPKSPAFSQISFTFGPQNRQRFTVQTKESTYKAIISLQVSHACSS